MMPPTDLKWFLQWEMASRDTIDVKRSYIDLAGDLVTGILLSQIVFWHLPGENGERLRVTNGDHVWLVKKRSDWWQECRITPKQFDRAAAILETKKLIITEVHRFQGETQKHIRIDWPVFLAKMGEVVETEGKSGIPQTAIPESTIGQKRNYPKSNSRNSPKVNSGITLWSKRKTESVSQTFKESNTPEVSTSSSQDWNSIPDSEKENYRASAVASSTLLRQLPAGQQRERSVDRAAKELYKNSVMAGQDQVSA